MDRSKRTTLRPPDPVKNDGKYSMLPNRKLALEGFRFLDNTRIKCGASIKCKDKRIYIGTCVMYLTNSSRMKPTGT